MPTDRNAYSLLGPGQGELLEAGDNRLTIKVASSNQFVCEYSAPANFPGPPLHVHPGFDETFVVLDGRLEMTIGAQRTALEPGATAYVTGSVPHTFRNPADERTRFLLICSPGGMDDYFRGIAAGNAALVAAAAARVGFRAVAEPATA